MEIEDLIEEGIYNSPLALLSITDTKLINKIDSYLPYSIGIEIECMKSSNFNLDSFTNIPDIIEVDIDNMEQRFRIPNGLAGLICLYNICHELKLNSEFNPLSGHHYHVDMTNTYDLISYAFINKHREWILKELDTWDYKGSYNSREVSLGISSSWMRFQSSFKTAEIRIGSMSFDYTVIVKRIIHACKIIQYLNRQLVDVENIVYTIPNKLGIKERLKTMGNTKLISLTNQLKSLTKVDNFVLSDEDKKQIIKNRIIKI